MRSLFSKFGMLALTAVVGSVALGGCSGSSIDPSSGPSARGEKTGTVGLLLQPVAGLTVNQVHYAVTKGATVVGEGDLPTPGTAASLSFGLSLPVGTGYTLTLSGKTVESDAITCTGTFGTFNVTANASTDVSIVLTCTDSRNGSIATNVQVVTDACPRLVVDYAVATPSSAKLGEKLAVLSKATDLDGRAVTYAWSVGTASLGAFDAATSKDTNFKCNGAADNFPLTITADNGQCKKTLTTKVSCVNEQCGNGVVDPGEQCDKALTPATCPADCTFSCGDGVAEAPAEDCDPPVAGVCSATCKTVPIVCGDTFKQAGEGCDDGNTVSGDGCSSTCQVEAPISCGDGIKNGTEDCEPKYSENCGGDCKFISKAACNTCAVANCAGAENCSGVPDSAACNKTLDCVRDSGCADGGFALFCYCGAVSSTECDTAGGAKGACKAEIEAGLGSTDPIFIQNNLFDTGKSAGKAMARVDCELSAGCATSCKN